MPSRAAETRLVMFFCVLAGVRAVVFSAAFPLFGNVDEQSHFDLIAKYARGHIPGRLEPWDGAVAREIVLYGSPEYFETPDGFPGGVFPGPRTPGSVDDRLAFEAEVARLVASINHESTQPPVYYAVAGAWSKLAAFAGLRGARALYGTRFLNGIVYGLLTWSAFIAARTFFLDNRFVRLGVPLLIAFFPQDVFYTVNNDVLLPLAGGAAFFGLLVVGERPEKGYAFHAAVGLLVAACVLVKLSSVAVFPVAAGVVAFGILRSSGEARRAAVLKGAVLLGAAAVPIGLWCARSAWLSGDVTGSAAKARLLGWTVKPLTAVFDHPLFTLNGLAKFWRETMASFWRGELVWGLKPLASPVADTFYALSSLVFVAASSFARRRRFVMWTGLALFLLSLAFLATISVIFDFGECFYPSRESPFLVSGRLALGALVPFATLYVGGLDALIPSRAGRAPRWTILIVAIALAGVSELHLSRVAFHSAYNWFHLAP